MRRALVVLLPLLLVVGIIGASTLPILPRALAANCVAKDNLDEKARSFIGRCCRGSINQEFPGELYELTLGAIQRGQGAIYAKGWKLLNDGRFKK